LFPAVVAGATISFPLRYRGLATTLILAMMDIGFLIGAPLIGGIVHYAEFVDLAPYPTMFVTVSVLLALATVIYTFKSVPVRQASTASEGTLAPSVTSEVQPSRVPIPSTTEAVAWTDASGAPLSNKVTSG
jgi:hypothetical protein